MKPQRCWTLCLFLLLALATTAGAQTCVYMDFDDDDDPYTIRTVLPAGITSTTVRFVLEVPPDPPLGREFLWSIAEGCCNDPDMNGHYATYVDPPSVSFDPQFVSSFELAFATCTDCCPWMVDGFFAADAPMAPGERYFIGQADWNVYCDLQAPCVPPTSFTATFSIIGQEPECEESSTTMVFDCVPSPIQPTTWGSIKSILR